MDDFESGMYFIMEPREEICKIETTYLYGRVKNVGTKTVDYIRIRNLNQSNLTLAWIEAKTTFAKPKSSGFDAAIDDVVKKFVHSLELFASVMMNKILDDKSELEKFRHIYETASFQMILVVKTHKYEWLSRVQDALQSKLTRHCKIWNIEPNKDILVFNEEGAAQHQLIRKPI